MYFRSPLPSLRLPSTQRLAAQPSQRMSFCSRHLTASSSATNPAHLRSRRARHPADTLALASASALTARLSDERLLLLALAASLTLSLATTERNIDEHHPQTPSSTMYTTYDCDTTATFATERRSFLSSSGFLQPTARKRVQYRDNGTLVEPATTRRCPFSRVLLNMSASKSQR